MLARVIALVLLALTLIARPAVGQGPVITPQDIEAWRQLYRNQAHPDRARPLPQARDESPSLQYGEQGNYYAPPPQAPPRTRCRSYRVGPDLYTDCTAQ